MNPGPAFGAPATPTGRGDPGAEPIRIVDPAGGAVAWIAPGDRAGCTGFAVRRQGTGFGGRVDVLPHAASTIPEGRPGGAWIAPIVVHRASPAGAAADGLGAIERAVCWRFAGRDPTAVVLAAEIAPGPSSAGPGTGEAAVCLRFTARLDDATLSLAVEATNEGTAPVAVGLGLRVARSGAPPSGSTADSEPGENAGVCPGAVVAHWPSPDAALIAVTALDGVRHVASAPSGSVGTASVLVLGFVPSRGLEDLQPGASRVVSASIGLLAE